MPTDQELADYLTDPGRDARFGSLITDGNNGEIQRLLNADGFGTVNRSTLTGADIFDAVDLTEFEALSTSAQDRVKFLIQISGDIPVGPSSKARAWLLDAFPSGGTFDELVALVERSGSEAEVQWGAGTVILLDQIRRAL